MVTRFACLAGIPRSSSFVGVYALALRSHVKKGRAETRRPHVAISGETARMNFLARSRKNLDLAPWPTFPSWANRVNVERYGGSVASIVHTHTHTHTSYRSEKEDGAKREKDALRCVSLRSTSNCDVVAGACPRSRFKTVSTALLDRFFLAEAGLHPFAFIVRACVRACAATGSLCLPLCGPRVSTHVSTPLCNTRTYE